MVLNDIYFHRANQKICRNCVDKLQGRGKSEILNKVGYGTMYEKDESEEE